MTRDQGARAIAAVFGEHPLGRDALHMILDHAGVYEAPAQGNADEQRQAGARGLALDIALMAGLMPAVPGARPIDEDQPEEAAGGSRAQGEPRGEEAER